MADWRSYLLELPSRRWIDKDLPLLGAQVTRPVNGPAAISGSIPLGYAQLERQDGTPSVTEWGCLLIAERDGEEPVSAIVDGVAIDDDRLQLDAGGFSMYPVDTPWLGPEFIGIKVDPLDMVRKIWDHLQSYPDGDLKVTVDPLKTPEDRWVGEPERDVSFQTGAGENVEFSAGPFRLSVWGTDDLGRVIADLAEATPFEYRERSSWLSDEAIVHRIELGYPSLGARRHDIRFEIGINVVVPPPATEEGYASEILMLGAGEGRKRMDASAHLTRTTNRLRRVKVLTDKNLQSKKSATAAARPILDKLTGRYEITSVIVVDHPSAPFSSFEPGDEIRIVGDAGWIQLDHWVRIVESADDCETGRRTLRVVTV